MATAQNVGRELLVFAGAVLAGVLASHPIGRYVIAPLVVLAVILAAYCMTVAGMGAAALYVSRDPRTRVIRGLERACVAILRERGRDAKVKETFQPDEMRIVVDSSVSRGEISEAAREAVRRFRAGITQDAYSTECTTNAAVTLSLVFLVIVGSLVAMFVFGVPPLIALVLTYGIKWAVFPFIAHRLGLFVQRRWTVSTQFTHVDVGEPDVIDGVVRVPIGVTI